MPNVYLTTKYQDRERVKALGARWDADIKRWYLPEGLDATPFAPWLPPEALPTMRAHEGRAPALTQSAGEIATGKAGISLSSLLSGVAQAVSQAYRAGVWTRVEVVKADVRRGHIYLELAERNVHGDSVAQARAMIWQGTANEIVPEFERATGVVLGAGIKLLVRAKPTMHALYGLSLIVDGIDPAYTLGDLEAKKREIRARLTREGLLDANKLLPQAWDYTEILVVAPEGAAGLGDFKAEAARLQAFGVCRFTYVFSRFQGENAAAEIRAALLRALDEWAASGSPKPDAVVLIRGGGAVNDLAWLNDYDLARCICELPVPVLTGIGHERDSTILDEVANQKFDTPSKVVLGIEQLVQKRAAEARKNFDIVTQIASGAAHSVRRTLDAAHNGVKIGAQKHVAKFRQTSHRMIDDVRAGAWQLVNHASHESKDLLFDMRHLTTSHLVDAKLRVPACLSDVRVGAREALRAARTQVASATNAVADCTARTSRSSRETISRAIADVRANAERTTREAAERSGALMREIAGQGPEKTLGRGFALIRRADGVVVTSADSAATDVEIEIEFRDGRIPARVLSQRKRQ